MSTRTVIKDKPLQSAYIDNTLPEDICDMLELCKNANCTFYHPLWAATVCSLFIMNRCKGRCNREHFGWEELRPYAIPSNCKDVFTGVGKTPKDVIPFTEQKISSNNYYETESYAQ